MKAFPRAQQQHKTATLCSGKGSHSLAMASKGQESLANAREALSYLGEQLRLPALTSALVTYLRVCDTPAPERRPQHRAAKGHEKTTYGQRY